MSKQIYVLTILSFFFLQKNTFGQTRYVSDDSKYVDNVIAADSAFKSGDYKTCAACYEKAFEVTTKSKLSLFRAARCYSLNKKAKKAHYWLDKSLDDNVENVTEWLKEDDSFSFLKKKKKCWRKIDKKIKTYESTINVALRNELIKMQAEDQKHRHEIIDLQKKVGNDAPEVKALWEKQTAIDESNIKRIEEIIAEHGYPGKGLVGSRAMGATFLVIQHADLKYQEKYLPVLKEAAEKGELRKSSLALLIDRVNMRNNKPQIYGSQLKNDPYSGELWFHEIEDEKNVDARREEVGLQPLSEYAKFFDLEYPRKPYTREQLKGLPAAWELIRIHYPDTDEEIIPEKSYVINFFNNGMMKYNKEVNSCQTKFSMTLNRRVIFTPVENCTEKCCDKDISGKLQYYKATEYALTKDTLVLKGKDVVFVLKRKVHEKMKIEEGRGK